MIRRPTSIFFMTFIVVLSCLAMPALAVPQDGSGVNGGTVEIGSLSDRFESLDKLGNSLTDEESVVIETRVGVLVSANRALNGSEVSFTGEAVGDIVNADEGHKWVNIRGSSNSAISVYMPDDLAKLIQNVGDYHMTGTTRSRVDCRSHGQRRSRDPHGRSGTSRGGLCAVHRRGTASHGIPARQTLSAEKG